MDRKRFILLAAAAFLLAASVFTYISLSGDNTAVNKNQVFQEPSSTNASAESTTAVTTEGQQDQEVSLPVTDLIRSESIDVTGNSPEYDLKAALCEDSNKRTYISLEYYLDGTGSTIQADSSQLPELDGIFNKRDQAGNTSNSFRIRAAYLNPAYSKLYLQIIGNSFEVFEETTLYSLDLKNSTVKKLFSCTGKYSKINLNKNFSMLGYSFDDPPELSVFQESSLFDILDCKTDEFIVRGSKKPSGKLAGTDMDTTYLYNYSFIAWKSDNVARLSQSVFSRKDINGKPISKGEVLYDAVKDKFMNTDGSPLKNPAMAVPTETAAPVKNEAEVSKVLTDFYSYLPSEGNYHKAMEILDESFKLRLQLMEQFNVSEIIKSDIDEEGVSMVSELLKAAKLDSIVKVELGDGIYTIYYYQTMSLNSESQVRQALTAQLKKVGNSYKIILIKDADEEKPPFV